MNQTNNPLISSLKLPGRTFELPSKGIFYTDNELDDTVKNGEIHVRPLSAFDEITIKNPDMLFSGEALTSVIPSCASGVLKPNMLLSKDVDALLLYLRVVTYGPNYEFTAKHTCENAKDHSYVANIEEIISTIKPLQADAMKAHFTLKTMTGQTVILMPNRYFQILELVKQNHNKKQLTVDEQKENLLNMLLGIVFSVDGISDRTLIAEWLKTLPVKDINLMADRSRSVNDWGANTQWKGVCKDCGAEFTVSLPINPISFFTE